MLGLAQDEFRCKVQIPQKTNTGIFGLFGDNERPLEVTDPDAALPTITVQAEKTKGPKETSDNESDKMKTSESNSGQSGAGSTKETEKETVVISTPKTTPEVGNKKFSFIIHPEGIHALFELIKFAENEGKDFFLKGKNKKGKREKHRKNKKNEKASREKKTKKKDKKKQFF